MNLNLTSIDKANLSNAAMRRLFDGNLPLPPKITGLDWRPPSQTSPITQSTNNERMMIWANSDIHSYTEMMIDTPGGQNAPAGQVMEYWDGYQEAAYLLTMRSYLTLVPTSYTQVPYGNTFVNTYTSIEGISETASQSLSATLNVTVGDLGASISAEFGYSVTTSSETQKSTSYTVVEPKEGYVRVWMLWQLVDELVAIDPGTNQVLANGGRHAGVNWSEHEPGGAWCNYLNVDQHFPSGIFIPQYQDFPAS